MTDPALGRFCRRGICIKNRQVRVIFACSLRVTERIASGECRRATAKQHDRGFHVAENTNRITSCGGAASGQQVLELVQSQMRQHTELRQRVSRCSSKRSSLMRRMQFVDSAPELREGAAVSWAVQMPAAALALLPIVHVIRQSDRSAIMVDADANPASKANNIEPLRPIDRRFAKPSHTPTPSVTERRCFFARP